MAEQPLSPVVLMTRPPGQGAAFARALRARFGPLRIVHSPLIAPADLPVTLPAGHFAGCIFTSQAAVGAAARAGLPPGPAFCVGARTAAAARAAGHDAEALGGDADGLVAALLARCLTGPLLHLHGRDTRGDVAARLTAGGLTTVGVAVYAQEPRPLTPAARRLLNGAAPVILPLFSPRTAEILSAQARDVAAPLWIVAMSPAVDAAAQVPAVLRRIAAAPTAGAMLEAVATLPIPPAGA
jgi:uroporphyrinogen-III synthase